MGSGMKRMIINTQERAISPDINRLQAFAGKGNAEFLRYLMDVSGNDDLEAGAVITEYASLGTPLRAEIANGILVRPQVGSLDVLVDPGAMYAIAPDADADSSNYKFVKTAGVAILGSLVMTPNASGSDRIDVIECQVNPDVIVETDSRDIFNPSTGLFTAASVSKARENQLTFRVRAGTPAAGYPAAVSGWLPLAVARVPTGTTINDTITFWDVRPLLNDREFGSANLTRDLPTVSAGQLTYNPVTGLMHGSIDVVGSDGRRRGGRMRRGTPGVDAESISLTDVANQSGAAFVADTLRYLYLVTPFGLPRWAKYVDAPSTRVPRSPRGIPVLSDVPPQHQRNTPSAAIVLPTSTGLGGSTTAGVCVSVHPINAALAIGAVVVDAEAHYLTVAADALATAVSNVVVEAGTKTGTLTAWTLVPNVNYPANARELYVTFQLTLALPATQQEIVNATTVAITAGNPGDIPVLTKGRDERLMNAFGIPFTMRYTWSGWIPIPSTEYPAASGGTRQLQFNKDGGLAPTSARLSINGWRF